MAMKKLIPLLVILFAAPVFGQDVKPAENPVTANWSKLGPAVEGPRGFTLHGKGIRLNRERQYELWVKIVPANTPAFIKRYDLPKATQYVLQYATVDCEKKVLLLEKTAAYDSADKVLEGKTSALTPSSKKDPVRPGSVGESIFNFVCLDPTSLPLTEKND